MVHKIVVGFAVMAVGAVMLVATGGSTTQRVTHPATHVSHPAVVASQLIGGRLCRQQVDPYTHHGYGPANDCTTVTKQQLVAGQPIQLANICQEHYSGNTEGAWCYDTQSRNIATGIDVLFTWEPEFGAFCDPFFDCVYDNWFRMDVVGDWSAQLAAVRFHYVAVYGPYGIGVNEGSIGPVIQSTFYNCCAADGYPYAQDEMDAGAMFSASWFGATRWWGIQGKLELNSFGAMYVQGYGIS